MLYISHNRAVKSIHQFMLLSVSEIKNRGSARASSAGEPSCLTGCCVRRRRPVRTAIWGPLVLGLLETLGGGYRRGLGPSLKLRATVTVCYRPVLPLSETTTNPAKESKDVFLGFSAAG